MQAFNTTMRYNELYSHYESSAAANNIEKHRKKYALQLRRTKLKSAAIDRDDGAPQAEQDAAHVKYATALEEYLAYTNKHYRGHRCHKKSVDDAVNAVPNLLLDSLAIDVEGDLPTGVSRVCDPETNNLPTGIICSASAKSKFTCVRCIVVAGCSGRGGGGGGGGGRGAGGAT